MSLSLKQQIGQMLIAGFKGLEIEQDHSIVRDIIEYNISGVILYDEDVTDPNKRWCNIQTPEQTRQLINSLQDVCDNKLIISVDQEGGYVNRLKEKYGFPPCPSWSEIGSVNNIKKTKDFSETIAKTLKDTGFNLNIAPVVDVKTIGKSYIRKLGRCFHSDPKTIAEHASVFISAHKERGIATTLKHFPGLGSASADTHEGFADITDSWTEDELLPYKMLLDSLDVDLIMIGHCIHRDIDPDYPASMSTKTVNGLLRSELGFDGIVICDDPMMGAISKNYAFETAMEKIINAGVDLLCFGNNLVYDKDIVSKAVDTIYHLVEIGKISADRIIQSFNRIHVLKSKLR
ncbi:MAG: glycoside hydrolase family 3 protein [Candidatus Marinimicrobia bacterium]|nr:glycoside hydrolase family 3 protein [Candidatus Neomarinimicrobiota bacterium]